MNDKKYRIAFFGSDEIALPSLNFLQNECLSTEISAILTQPDRRVGRGRKLKSNSIKQWAESNKIPLISPDKPNLEDCEWLKEKEVDFLLVMAYGHILKNFFLELAPLGCYNLHASILPKYRGASPIETAMALGEDKTGVTLMRIVQKMDAGPIVDCESVGIEKLDTGSILRNKISSACIPLLERNINNLMQVDTDETEQDETSATYCRKLTKNDGNLDFYSSAVQLVDRIRAFQSWPGCKFSIEEEKISIGDAETCKNELALKPGETHMDERGNLLIGTADGILVPKMLQRPGGRALETKEFLRGFNFPIGSTLLSSKMEELLLSK